jgi:hypothetical protein
MPEEGEDLIYGKLFNRESTGVVFLVGDESKQQLNAVAITVDRMGTHGPLAWKVVGKKAV